MHLGNIVTKRNKILPPPHISCTQRNTTGQYYSHCFSFVATLNIPALTGCRSGCRHSCDKATVLGMAIKETSSIQTPPNKYWQDGTDKHDATERYSVR